MVSDTDIVTCRRRQLEEEFGVDLSDRKLFVRDEIGSFMKTPTAEPDEGGR
jgi:hypothetical protein